MFRLTNTKRKVLDLLAEYFCLRTKDITELLRGRDPNPNDLRSTRFTLGKLKDEGYLTRLPYFDTGTQGVTYAWGLTDKALRTAWFVDNIQPNFAKTFDEHSERTLDHELEISQFHKDVKRLCAQKNWNLYWQQADLDCTIRPDAYFAIRKDGNTFHFFLEVERAKLSKYKNGEPSIIRKLANYYHYYNTPTCQKEWNFKQFRVIVTQRTPDRAAHLLAALKKQFDHRMFWITSGATSAASGTTSFMTTKGDALLFSDL